MEERIPTSDELPPPPPPPPPPPAAVPSLETYIVQIPRDQIYRVPPPEHARIIEEHKRRNSLNQENHCRSFFFACVFPAVIFIILAGGAFLAIRATLYSPTTPEFAVSSFHGRSVGPHRQPEFEIVIQARNPNSRFAVSYKEGGGATLALMGKKIGKGKTAAAVDGESGGAADIAVELGGEAAALSKEMEKVMNDNKEKSMELKIDGLKVEMKSWVRIERLNVKISCEFRVINSLMNSTKISFQECKTES